MSGIVAAGNHYTSRAGEEILAAGGNAVDAAVAATFVSFLGEIAFVHSGGSGLALLYDSRRNDCSVYDFFSSGPGLASQKAVQKDFSDVTVDFGSAQQQFHVGRASVAVPGNFFGLCKLAREHGRFPFSRLLEPAIRLAEEGVVLDAFQAETIRLLAPIYTFTPGIREIFCPKGKLVGEGEVVRIPDLARTLEDLAEQGESYLRTGRLAQALLKDQQLHGGLLTPEDLTGYRVGIRKALKCQYRGAQVWLPSLPSSGGPLIGLALKILDHFDVHREERLLLLAETMASVNQTRQEWEDWVENRPWDEAPFELWGDSRVDKLVQAVTESLRRGRSYGSVREPPSPSATTHISVIDGEGLAVSLTHTAGESAGYVVPGTGFIPNNMLGEADLHPRGFHLTRPGTRISTMMAPAILTSPELGCVVLGSGGSTRIRSAMLQVIHHLVDGKKTLIDAIHLPRIHYEAGKFQAEAGHDQGELKKAQEFGYSVNCWQGKHLYFGGANAVSLGADGEMHGAGDPRRGGLCRRVLDAFGETQE